MSFSSKGGIWISEKLTAVSRGKVLCGQKVFWMIGNVSITLSFYHQKWHVSFLLKVKKIQHPLTPKLKYGFQFFWSILDLQCCVFFRYTAKWISYSYTYIYSVCVCVSFSHIGHSRILSRVPYACYTVGS